ncbi:MAG: DUF2726 domain-containing protein [Burkholderiaceae bacterium]
MDWSWIVVTLAVPALLAGAWWGWRARRARDVPPLAAHDRFTPVAALSDVQMALMQYLVEAFAGRPVLFRAPLSQLVAPRGAGDRLQTQRRLAQHHVDFVVCNRAGKPLYAFELDAAHDSAEQAEHDAAEKHLILKAAGIRLIRIKRSTREMPSPREFRQRLRAAELSPAAPPSGRAPLPPAPASPAAPKPRAPATQPMSLTDLMGLPPGADDELWGSDRRHR